MHGTGFQVLVLVRERKARTVVHPATMPAQSIRMIDMAFFLPSTFGLSSGTKTQSSYAYYKQRLIARDFHVEPKQREADVSYTATGRNPHTRPEKYGFLLTA